MKQCEAITDVICDDNDDPKYFDKLEQTVCYWISSDMINHNCMNLSKCFASIATF
jgi:hypothetical protein